MDAERWRRVETLYHTALEREPGERTAYLTEACGGDEELRREVASLLAQDVSGSGLLEHAAWRKPASEEDTPPGGRHPFRWVVRLTAPVVVAVFAYAVWLLLTGSAPKSFGWSEVSRDGHWYIASVTPAGPAAGRLEPGDRLISLDGDPSVARVGTRPYQRALQVGEAYELTVLRDGGKHSLTLRVVRDPALLADSVVRFMVSLVWCGVGLFIGFARPDRLQARLAFLAGISTGLVYLQVGIFRSNFALWQPLHMVVGYHFFYRFPFSARPARFWRALLWLLYVGGAFAALVRQPGNWTYISQGASGLTRFLALHSTLLDAGSLVGLVTFFTAVAATVAVVVRNYSMLTDPDQRRRIQWVIYASFVGLAPLIWWAMVSTYERVIGQPPVPLLALAVDTATVAFPLGVAYAVVKHRVLDIKVAIRLGVKYLLAKRALQFLVALPVAALVYTVVVNRDQTIAELLTGSKGYLYWMAAAGLGLRFRGPLRRWLDRKFFRSEYDREQVLLGVLDELGKLGSISEVSRLVSGQLELAVHPKAVHLWYRDPQEMVLMYSSSHDLEGRLFPDLGNLLPLIEQEGAAVDVPLPPSAGLSEFETRWLAGLGVNLMVPVTGSGERLVGVLMLGEKKSEEPYSASDRRLLEAIARQTAVARENLRLKEQVGEEQRIRHDVLARLDPEFGNLLKECPSCGACFDSPAEMCDRDGQTLTLSLPVARTIDGKYRLDQLIGKGGMGAVYEARDLRLERSVAVKILVGRGFGEELALRRFQREARTVARLSHPNVVTVYDYGALEGEGAYLVMERVHGMTLRAEIDRLGVLPPPMVAEWFEQLLSGVAAAHSLGIVHRDLKPENVVGQRAESGSFAVKILDFGLAKFRSFETEGTAESSLTAAGVVIGTFGYMPPEQLQGGDVDQRCDIFALGVMLAETLTGSRPFQGETYGELAQAMLHDGYHLPDSFPETPALDAVLQRCLAKYPRDRFTTAEELRRELLPALQ